MMTPETSPAGLLGKPAKVKKLNHRAKALVICLLSLGVVLLLTSILSKGTVAGPSRDDEPEHDRKPVTANPPRALKKSEESAVTKVQSVTANPTALEHQSQLLKENFEFQKEIRKSRQQAYMARLSQYDSATAASTSIESADLNKQSPEEKDPGISQADEKPFGRLAAALGMPAIPGSLPNADPNLQGRKEEFSQRESMTGYLPFRKRAPVSPYEITTGTVIPGNMISGINSDLPGEIIGQVKETVYDTATGKYPLIPQGSRLIGTYDSMVAIGQEQVLISWRRIIFPDGSKLELMNMPGQNQGGYAGFNDLVDNRYFETFRSAILLSVVGAGYQMSQPRQSAETLPSNRDIVASQLGQQLSQVSAEKIRQSMQIQPRLNIRPGYEFIIAVNKDIILEPYTETP